MREYPASAIIYGVSAALARDSRLMQNKRKEKNVMKLSRRHFTFLFIPSLHKAAIWAQFAPPPIFFFQTFSNPVLEAFSPESADSQRTINAACQYKCSSLSAGEDPLGNETQVFLFFPNNNNNKRKSGRRKKIKVALKSSANVITKRYY